MKKQEYKMVRTMNTIRLISMWKNKAKELDDKAVKYNGRGGPTEMGKEATSSTDTLRQCIKDLQKEKNKHI